MLAGATRAVRAREAVHTRRDGTRYSVPFHQSTPSQREAPGSRDDLHDAVIIDRVGEDEAIVQYEGGDRRMHEAEDTVPLEDILERITPGQTVGWPKFVQLESVSLGTGLFARCVRHRPGATPGLPALVRHVPEAVFSHSVFKFNH